MGQIIAWSIADETLHTESMTMLFREYIKQNPQLWNDELKARIYRSPKRWLIWKIVSLNSPLA